MKTADYVVQQRKLVLYVVLLGSLLSLGGCSGNPKTWAKEISPPVSLGKDDRIVNDKKKGLDGYAGFNNALQEANQERSSISVEKKNNKNAALLTEGMNLIMGNCSRYFTALGNVGQDTSFIRKETTLAGTTVAALMGLADAGSKAISVTATAFGLTTATIDNFSDVYLFSPEIKNIQDLVMGALEVQKNKGTNYAQEANSNTQELTYTEVTQLLFEMESTCQPHGIHQLINTAVANNKVVPTLEESSVEQLQSVVNEFKAKADNAAEKLNIKKTSNLNRNQKEFTPSNLLMQKLKAEDELNRATTDASVIQKQLNDLEGKSDQESIARKAALENIKTTNNSKITEKESNFKAAQRKLVEYETALTNYKVLDQYAEEAEKEATEDEKKYEADKAKQDKNRTRKDSVDLGDITTSEKKAKTSKDKAIKLREMVTQEAQKIKNLSNSITTTDKAKRSLKYELQAK